ncbi:hypothetical protein GCM10023332_22080 [Luteimonas vadosa]|uniref:Histidine kinase/HSP90-like ATPase domain-containing protein n=1 Tax=Luteimonas vadosa TaxID=1165507 RepID=A0ABP9E5Q4_9GAMM
MRVADTGTGIPGNRMRRARHGIKVPSDAMRGQKSGNRRLRDPMRVADAGTGVPGNRMRGLGHGTEVTSDAMRDPESGKRRRAARMRVSCGGERRLPDGGGVAGRDTRSLAGGSRLAGSGIALLPGRTRRAR